jgi:TctA family transporter
MDWDILFLIPVTWASPVLYPVLISITLLVFAGIILYRCSRSRPVKTTLLDWLAFVVAGLIVVVSFCIAGLNVTEQDFKSYFYWPLFATGNLFAVAMFLKCLLKSK